MSSGSPGRYQSRLFNFINRQSRRLSDQYDRTVRHLKVAAVWGVQILLYPVYLVAQAGLSAGRQLSSAAQAGWPQLKALTHSRPQEPLPGVDTPIQHVLDEINTLELQLENWTVSSYQVERLAGHLTYPNPTHRGMENADATEEAKVSLMLMPTENVTLASENISDEQPLSTSNLQPVAPPQLSTTDQQSSHDCCLIQGVGSLLATRTLVLVTVENQILDILTPQQQRKLASKISWEVANLRRQWRIAQASRRQFPQRPLTTLDKPRVFLPVRLFWQLMGWVQTSPVAIAANLFEESTLVACGTPNPNQILLPTYTLQRQRRLPMPKGPERANGQAPEYSIINAPIPEPIAFLDRTIAELESHPLVPGSEVIIALRDRTQKFLEPLQSKFLTPEERIHSPQASHTNTFRIQALIYAAIKYFFGRNSSTLPDAASQERKTQQLSGRHSTALPPNSELADTSEPDPWLTWNDLFGNPDTGELTQSPTASTFLNTGRTVGKPHSQEPKFQAQLPEAFKGKIPVIPRNSVWNVIKSFLSRKQPPGKLSTSSSVESRIERSESKLQTVKLKNQSWQNGSAPTKRKTQFPVAPDSRSTNISPAKDTTTAITPPSACPDTDLEAAPDWIETQATPTGYVKHPLERLLEWLDLAMLWLEELIIKVWQWVKYRGRRH
jgi:hypothetical protein